MHPKTFISFSFDWPEAIKIALVKLCIMRSRSKDFNRITYSYLNKNSKTLKGKCFWNVKIPQQSTWGCRNLLKIGNIEDKQFLKFEVGDGKNIFLWLNWWHLDGVLYQVYGYRMVHDAASSIEAKLVCVA